MSFDRVFFKYAIYLPTVWVRGEALGRYLEEFEHTQWASAASLRDLQERKLNRLIDWACMHVPFYRERIDRGRLPKRLTLDDLSALPTLSKADLRDRASALVVDCHERTTIKTTGGSTGQAVTVTKSRTATAQELAAMWRGWRWAGINIGDRQARFWGVPRVAQARLRAKLVDFVSHRRRYSAFNVGESDMMRYTESLNAFQPDYVYGYVSMLAVYGAYLEKSGSRRFSPKAVIATAEVLTAPDRAVITRGFGCPVFEEYGCGELGNIAHQCDKGGLHLSAENLAVELVGAANGEPGEVVVTELNNLAMPLIRYRLNDYAAPTNEPCPCGRTLPRIRAVFGRAYDLVYNREGRMFQGEFFMYIFEDAKQRSLGIDQFQVVQRDFDHFTIRVRPGQDYSAETEAFVRQRIQDGYGPYAQVEFQRVDAIEREASGKLRLIIGCGQNAAVAPRGGD
jgi:phenylacetate-coenzyme A ligase PaaK-like adenylate-forming protein